MRQCFIFLLLFSLFVSAQSTVSGGTVSAGKFGDNTPKSGTDLLNVNFEDGTVGAMTASGNCTVDATTGANGTSKSVKCTCAYTSAPSSACGGGGGQSDIVFTYSGADPVYSGELWESYWIKTDTSTITAANTSTSQIKTYLRRKNTNANSNPDFGWDMHGFGNTFAGGGILRIILKDFGLILPSAANTIDLSDQAWHRVVMRHRMMAGEGCTTVWVDDMVTPKKTYCALDIGNTAGSGTNYVFRLGIVYGAYGGASNGTYTIWNDEIRASTYDIR